MDCTWYIDVYRSDTDDHVGNRECGEWTASGTYVEHQQHPGYVYVDVDLAPGNPGRPE